MSFVTDMTSAVWRDGDLQPDHRASDALVWLAHAAQAPSQILLSALMTSDLLAASRFAVGPPSPLRDVRALPLRCRQDQPDIAAALGSTNSR
jgi:hypothetical protein